MSTPSELSSVVIVILIKRALGSRVWNYVSVILNADLVFGLRDKVAHGLCQTSELNRNEPALLIYICLLLTNMTPRK
jgi:hypothetical protein